MGNELIICLLCRVTEKEDDHKAAADDKIRKTKTSDDRVEPGHVTTASQSPAKHVSDSSALSNSTTVQSSGVKVSTVTETPAAHDSSLSATTAATASNVALTPPDVSTSTANRTSASTNNSTPGSTNTPGNITTPSSTNTPSSTTQPRPPVYVDLPDGRSNTSSPAKSSLSDAKASLVTATPANGETAPRVNRVSELSSHMTATSKQAESKPAPPGGQSLGVSHSATNIPQVTRPPVNQQLPSGWERRLDNAIGRYYYIDHNTHSTHWNPPQLSSQLPTVKPAPGELLVYITYCIELLYNVVWFLTDDV